MQTKEEFSNQVVLPDQLAPVEVQVFEGLEPKYKWLKHIGSTIFFVVALFVFFLIDILSSEIIPTGVLIAVPSAIVFLFIWRLVIVSLGFPKKGYLLRERDVSYRRGILVYKLTTIPFNRIQHVEVSQNLIEKSFGLSRLKIFTAGGSVSDLSIPGLLPGKAQQIESFLLNKVSKHE